MKKKFLFYIVLVIVLALVAWLATQVFFWYEARLQERARNQAIDNVLQSHRAEILANGGETDLFGTDNLVKILVLGLDSRVGQTAGHCDVIQFMTIDQKNKTVKITAVPRGTYSPLPPGTGKIPSDYYVSNACGLGGLKYGIEQIEKILGERPDYLVTVGFSETLGILRDLKLPTTETLQWLRVRHAYQIGEPQRAHNHSSFLKYLLLKFVATPDSTLDKISEYLLYKTVQTDLSFQEAEKLVSEIQSFDLAKHPDRIQLTMRPAYTVEDIEYAPEAVSAYLSKMLDIIDRTLPDTEYSAGSQAKTQERLLAAVRDKSTDEAFIKWSFENAVWLQVEDESTRLALQFEFLKKYLAFVPEVTKRQSLISDYILEMEYRGLAAWAARGRELFNIN